jgi:predicted nucleotidyltransferase
VVYFEAMESEIRLKEIGATLNRALQKREEVRVVYLFGSRARGSVSNFSDIDIGVLLNEDFIKESVYGYRADLTAELISLLRTDKIDLVVLNHAPPLLAHRVVRDGIVLHCKDESERIAFEVKMLNRFLDTAPLRERQNEYLKKSVLA